MNILGIGNKKLVVGTRACQKFLQPADKRRAFLRAQHRGARKSVGVSDARADIGLEEPPVKPERVIKLAEGFIGPFGKTSAPEICRTSVHRIIRTVVCPKAEATGRPA